jgi:hypothetical protein
MSKTSLEGLKDTEILFPTFCYNPLHSATMRYILLHFCTQPASNLTPEKEKQPKTQRTKTATQPLMFCPTIINKNSRQGLGVAKF